MSRLWSRSHRLAIAVCASVLAMVWLVASPSLARADDKTPSSWRITKYHVVATPAKDGGNTRVEIDLDFDFARDSGHGPFIVLPNRMGSPDPDAWRMLDTRIVSVSSGTGANANQHLETQNGNLVLRIGSDGKTYRGVQNYKITYMVHGILFPNHPESHLDEFNWNAVGNAWQVPMRDIRVTVNAPAAPRKTACWTGSSFRQQCDAPAPARTMTWTRDSLRKGEGLQVVAGFPVGTFTHAEFRTTTRHHVGNMFPLTPASVAGAGVLSAAGIGGAVVLARRGRDQEWAGLTPGTTPLDPNGTPTQARQSTTTAVAFRPPKGVRPGEVGTLIDEKADMKDVSATIIDLAVRRHLRIEQLDPRNQRLTRLQGPDELANYEQKLLNSLFQGRQVVTTAELRDKSRGSALSDCKTDLYERVSKPPLQWFTSNPSTTRTLWAFGGFLLAGLGVGLMVLLGFAGWGLVPLGVVVAGIALMAVSGRIPSRTPAGSAVYTESKGFELYLTTAEAEQIQFEEGIDVFSRYLPYAMVFGVADRWTKIFEKLAAEGRYYADTSWYVSPYGWGMHGFSSTVSGLTSSMESAMQASAQAASSSNSGSGFSGGGGAGGGGGGGW